MSRIERDRPLVPPVDDWWLRVVDLWRAQEGFTAAQAYHRLLGHSHATTAPLCAWAGPCEEGGEAVDVKMALYRGGGVIGTKAGEEFVGLLVKVRVP